MTFTPLGGTLLPVGRPQLWSIILLLAAALLLRAGWALSRPARLDAKLGDQTEYLGFARSVVTTGQYQYFDPRFETQVYAWRSPGYPLFVAGLGANLRGVRLAQALIDASTVLAIYLLARQWLAHRGSLVAAGLVAFNPFLIYFTGLILSESLYIALVAWAMTLLVQARRTMVIAGMLLLAFSVLVRPAGIGLAILLPAVAGLRLSWRAGCLQVLGAVAALVLVVGPWALRNRLHPQLQSWVWSTTNGGITRYDGFHPGATGASDQRFLDKVRPMLAGMTELERDRWFSQQAGQWISTHPGEAGMLAFAKIARTWSPIPLSTEYGNNRLYLIAGLLYAVPLDLLILIGLMQWQTRTSAPSANRQSATSNPQSLKLFLLLPAIYLTAIHAFSVGSLRYRLPAEPPMAVLAAAGVVALFHRILNVPSQRNA